MRKILLLVQVIIGVLFTLFALCVTVKYIIGDGTAIAVIVFAILLTLGVGFTKETIDELKNEE